MSATAFTARHIVKIVDTLDVEWYIRIFLYHCEITTRIGYFAQIYYFAIVQRTLNTIHGIFFRIYSTHKVTTFAENMQTATN